MDGNIVQDLRIIYLTLFFAHFVCFNVWFCTKQSQQPKNTKSILNFSITG